MLDYNVTTQVVTEPVTLAEAKLHIRLSPDAPADDLTTYQSIAPGSHAIITDFGLLGSSVDVLGLITIVNLNAGTCESGGSIAAKIQESDDNATWEDYAGGAFTTVTAANDNSIQKKTYSGSMRYVRVVATVAGNACEFSADIVVMSSDYIEDTAIMGQIKAARDYCEKITWRALATQTITAYPTRFPSSNELELPRPPLQSVTSIKYKNSDGTEATLTETTDYLVDDERMFGRIVLAYGKSWPTFTPYPMNPIKIEYVAGYSETNLIPETTKQAMLILIGHWYFNREPTGTASGYIASSVNSLLSMDKVGGWV